MKTPTLFNKIASGTWQQAEEIIKNVDPEEELVLFHSGTADEDADINTMGVLAQMGEWVEECLWGATDEEECIRQIKEKGGAAYFDDAPRWISAKVQRVIQKNEYRHNVTLDDIRKHGQLTIVVADLDGPISRYMGGGHYGDEYQSLRGEKYVSNELPYGLEPGDFFSTEDIMADITLTGDDLIQFIEKNYPGQLMNPSQRKFQQLSSYDQRCEAPNQAPVVASKAAGTSMAERVIAKARDKENAKVLLAFGPGEFPVADTEYHGAYLLADGSIVASYPPGMRTIHSETWNTVGKEVMEKTNPIRVAFSNTFLLPTSPTSAQVREMGRLFREGGQTIIFWKVGNEDGEGGFKEFVSAIKAKFSSKTAVRIPPPPSSDEEWSSIGPHAWKANFHIKAPEAKNGYIHYSAWLNQEVSPEPWLPVFSIPGKAYSFVFDNLDYRGPEGSFGVTGTGHTIEVGMKVGSLLLGVLKNLHPTMMYFSAKEGNRAVLYGRLTRLAAMSSGYTPYSASTSDGTYFILVSPESNEAYQSQVGDIAKPLMGKAASKTAAEQSMSEKKV